jgi:hypothetical protein
VVYARFPCVIINNYSSCLGRNILKEPISILADCGTLQWACMVGLYSAWMLRLGFNLKNYASNIFYLLSHILSLSRRSLQHPSRAAASKSTVADYHRSSSPIGAQARSIGSSLVLTNIQILPFCCTRCRAFSALRGTACAPTLRGAEPRAHLPCAARHRAAQGRRRAARRREFPAWRVPIPCARVRVSAPY